MKLNHEPQLIEFPEQTVVIAKDQPEYRPLPAFQYAHDPTGRLTCCWKLSVWDRLKLLFTGKLWHTIMAFHQPLQPQLLQVKKPFTTEDIAAIAVAKKAAQTLHDFKLEMLQKYGEAARKKQAKMDALNYHPNDRRRCLRFEPADFAAAQKHGLLFLNGVRIVDSEYKSAV